MTFTNNRTRKRPFTSALLHRKPKNSGVAKVSFDKERSAKRIGEERKSSR